MTAHHAINACCPNSPPHMPQDCSNLNNTYVIALQTPQPPLPVVHLAVPQTNSNTQAKTVHLSVTNAIQSQPLEDTMMTPTTSPQTSSLKSQPTNNNFFTPAQTSAKNKRVQSVGDISVYVPNTYYQQLMANDPAVVGFARRGARNRAPRTVYDAQLGDHITHPRRQ
jgi:hypothetical protein